MAEQKPRKKQRANTKPYDALAAMDCESVTYDIEVPIHLFDLERFSKETSRPPSYVNWSTVCYAKRKTTGYHVHLDGHIKSKEVTITLKYYGRSTGAVKGKGPFAETVMTWIGGFIKGPKVPVWVYASLTKPNTNWRSRFNLPFKVTMAGSKTEVTIDGISMDLPQNRWGAVHGWLDKFSTRWSARIMLVRSIEFSTFSLEDELPLYNEAIKMFVEERRP